ncbi:MAG: ADP-ribosylglycohydrolase family protein [Syntrophomonadaceae bacterium]|nr:ADP-ribosylglycohydrolase family protein [Syntrophomonadaceae bacterium]
MKRDKEHFRGCLLGGAVGDALGAPVEFLSLEEIKRRFGPAGVTGLPKRPGGKNTITDDTQMTLFTAEGLLRAFTRQLERGLCYPPSVVHHAYIRWLHTQSEENRYINDFSRETDDGWLINAKELHHRRAPGVTCLSALKGAEMGTVEKPINDSKGCGGVMRTAPVGLIADKPFEWGCDMAAITHGHPCGYLPGGVLAQIIADIIEGMTLEQAITQSFTSLKTMPFHHECLNIIKLALDLLEKSLNHEDNIRKIGEGWVGEEALAISLYCSLAAESDFAKGVCLAVNHDGDSDSTGAITGNILGAYLGQPAIPQDWLYNLELTEETIQIADDLLIQYRNDDEWRQKYPGW